jgi:malyl-CoA/(S)-citramalyl-CoA lyase
MRNPKDFFKPMAIGAPAPVREIPFRPSRMIHFFDPSNPKMAAKAPSIAAKCDVLLGNLEDAIQADNKVAAREGFIQIAKENDFGDCQLWTRVNSLDSPWFLDDMTQIVEQVGDKVDVIMIPKVEGPWDIHFVDRLLAQLEARGGVKRPILVHAILETALGVANVEEIAGASPRMQGMSLGPADLAASRRMKTTRVGGGHPGYLVREDPNPDDPDVRSQRHLRVLRPVWRHPGRRRMRGPVPKRVPARLRGHLVTSPGADRHREEGVQPAGGRGPLGQARHRSNG